MTNRIIFSTKSSLLVCSKLFIEKLLKFAHKVHQIDGFNFKTTIFIQGSTPPPPGRGSPHHIILWETLKGPEADSNKPWATRAHHRILYCPPVQVGENRNAHLMSSPEWGIEIGAVLGRCTNEVSQRDTARYCWEELRGPSSWRPPDRKSGNAVPEWREFV